MVRILIALAVVALCVSDASAFGRRNRQCNTTQCNTTQGVAVYRPLASYATGVPQYGFFPTPQFPVVRQVFGGCSNGSCPVPSTVAVPSDGPLVLPVPSK
jgi:hypothetical protein